MTLTLQIIIGIIVGSWLIALCFKGFRYGLIDNTPEIFSDFYELCKDDDNSIIEKILWVVFVFFIAYPLIIIIIILFPIIYAVSQPIRIIYEHRKKV